MKTLRNIALVCLAGGFLAACGSSGHMSSKSSGNKFSPKKYGVAGSPKVVAHGKAVPKGGGRYMVGKKYKIAGKWYYPKHNPNYKKVGLASWYGPTFHGRKTANGEIFDRNSLTAAHTTMPLPSYARVTNMKNGRSMVVRVNDRGPFHGNRVIDLSERVAKLLGTKSQGVSKVKVEYVGRAPLHGRDEQYLMASLTGPGSVAPGATRPGTMLAMAEPATPQAQEPFSVLSGAIRVPQSRPYIPAQMQVASQARPASVSVAFDPAIAFETSRQNTLLASNANRAPAVASENVLKLPSGQPAQNIVTGSAVSSYAAGHRIDAAHDLFDGVDTSGSLPFAVLAANGSSR